MGNPLPVGHFDTNALSWGNYGVVRGIGTLLDCLARHDVKASVMVSGILAERIARALQRSPLQDTRSPLMASLRT